MEDTHWVMCLYIRDKQPQVLILVVMEDTHWDFFYETTESFGDGLNPCCNGRYSLSYWILLPIYYTVKQS